MTITNEWLTQEPADANANCYYVVLTTEAAPWPKWFGSKFRVVPVRYKLSEELLPLLTEKFANRNLGWFQDFTQNTDVSRVCIRIRTRTGELVERTYVRLDGDRNDMMFCRDA